MLNVSYLFCIFLKGSGTNLLCCKILKVEASPQHVTLYTLLFISFNKTKKFPVRFLSTLPISPPRHNVTAAIPYQRFPSPVTLLVRNDLPSYLLSIFVCVSARPEEMGTGAHSSALIRFLQEFGCSKSTLSPQRFMVFFTEALHPLKSTNDQGDGSQLCFGITDFIFVQRKCLVHTEQK